MVAAGPSVDAAYAYCQRLVSAHYENFPVASLLLPRHMRPHIAAVYAFARVADDIADEGDASPAERLAALDAWRARLRDADQRLHLDARGRAGVNASFTRHTATASRGRSRLTSAA